MRASCTGNGPHPNLLPKGEGAVPSRGVEGGGEGPLNPLAIFFWGAVFAGRYSGSGRGEGGALGLYAAGCVSATLLFLSAVAAFGGWLKLFLAKPTALLWLNRAVGLYLIGFAAKLALGAW